MYSHLVTSLGKTLHASTAMEKYDRLTLLTDRYAGLTAEFGLET